MLDPWNDASLLPPPVYTFLCSRSVGIHELRSTCKNIIKILSNQSPLHKEGAILSRFAYKYDKKFRGDIGYRHFKKVNVALHKYLRLGFLKDIENFNNALPSTDDDLYLPTKQMLQYVLIRLITFSKIMLRIYICSKQGAVFYLDRIKHGESHWMSLMPYAVLSRVWSMCSVLLHHACSWYAQLLPWLDKLQIKGVAFLPDNYILPENLECWLDLKNMDNFGRFEWTPSKSFKIQGSLIEDEDVDNDNLQTILDYVNMINESDRSDEELPEMQQQTTEHFAPLDSSQLTKNTDQGEKISRQTFTATMQYSLQKQTSHLTKNTDQGEKITRENFTATMQNPLQKQPEVRLHIDPIHSSDNVSCTKSLKEFLSKEETYRNENSNLSLTKHLSFMQWQALKNSLSTLSDSISNKRKIEKKFKKIWKEKCTDYS